MRGGQEVPQEKPFLSLTFRYYRRDIGVQAVLFAERAANETAV